LSIIFCRITPLTSPTRSTSTMRKNTHTVPSSHLLWSTEYESTIAAHWTRSPQSPTSTTTSSTSSSTPSRHPSNRPLLPRDQNSWLLSVAQSYARTTTPNPPSLSSSSATTSRPPTSTRPIFWLTRPHSPRAPPTTKSAATSTILVAFAQSNSHTLQLKST
jgi:hypothetical protein